jgi:hypothetical protein
MVQFVKYLSNAFSAPNVTNNTSSRPLLSTTSDVINAASNDDTASL